MGVKEIDQKYIINPLLLNHMFLLRKQISQPREVAKTDKLPISD